MFEKTATSLPPKHEVLAVQHKFANMPGGTVDEEAIWDGEQWTSRRTNEKFEKNYYHLWRRLET